MPSGAHEAVCELVRNEPAAVPELLGRLLQVTLPAFVQARLESAELTQLKPTEFRADAVVVLTDDDGNPLAAVVVEVQRSCDSDKRFTWPVYLATLRARWRCGTLLVVIASDATVARWCARGIDMGHPDWVLKPLVVGPDAIPVVTDLEEARDQPWLAVLSLLAHNNMDRHDKVFRVVASTFSALDENQVYKYLDVLSSGLPEEAFRHLKGIMNKDNFPYISDFARQNYLRGQVENGANAILTVLGARGLQVPDTARAEITSCTDMAKLQAWLQRAANARSVDEIFD
jgi:hypothetical protein